MLCCFGSPAHIPTAYCGGTGPNRRSCSSCQRKYTGVTEMHVEYTSWGKQSHFCGLSLHWCVLNTKSFFFPLVALGWWKESELICEWYKKWQFSKFTQKVSEPVHPGICLQQEPNHLLGFPLTCMRKTLHTRLCAAKEGREEKLERWHASPLPPFPCNCEDLNSDACLHQHNKEREVSRFRLF